MSINGAIKPRILFIVAASVDELMAKGVESMLHDREEGGYFERVVTVHPFANQDQVKDLNKIHQLHEFRETYPFLWNKIKPLRFLNHFFYVIKLVFRMVALIKTHRLNLIRGTDSTTTGLLAWMVSRLTQTPFCVSIHADYEKRYALEKKGGGLSLLGSRRLAKAIEKFTLSRANLVLPIRSSLKDKLVSSGVPIEKIRLIPHGIDFASLDALPIIDIKQCCEIQNNLHILSFVGRLSKENYIYDLVRLGAELKKKRSDFLILLVGNGPEQTELQKEIKNKNLEKEIRLMGAVPRAMALSIRKSSTAALCLMGGYSLIEACWASCPVITYNVEWHSELIQNRQTGLFVPEHDIQKLVSGVEFLLDNPEEAKIMGETARRMASERHDTSVTSKIKCQVYDELLAIKTH
jgi:glycosyltransferase involved in cell wall biosynthesis